LKWADQPDKKEMPKQKIREAKKNKKDRKGNLTTSVYGWPITGKWLFQTTEEQQY
jgi:hypothetical protein